MTMMTVQPWQREGRRFRRRVGDGCDGCWGSYSPSVEAIIFSLLLKYLMKPSFLTPFETLTRLLPRVRKEWDYKTDSDLIEEILLLWIWHLTNNSNSTTYLIISCRATMMTRRTKHPRPEYLLCHFWTFLAFFHNSTRFNSLLIVWLFLVMVSFREMLHLSSLLLRTRKRSSRCTVYVSIF